MTYLLIETGYEGIESLCWLTDDPVEVKEQFTQFSEKKVKYLKDLFKDSDLPIHRTPQQIKDFFCVQKWNGKAFKCVCEEIGTKPSKLMLR